MTGKHSEISSWQRSWGLEREEYTTQISNYDNLGAIFDAMKRINTIMIDMNRDFLAVHLYGVLQTED